MVVTVIGVVGVFFLGMGMFALAAPAVMLRPFDYVLKTTAARAEVRGVYGGFGLAVAAVLGYAAWTSEDAKRTGILVTVGAALTGMAFGRAVSALFDGPTRFYPNWFYCLVEAIGAAALFWAAFS